MCCKTPYWFTLRGLKSNSPVLHGPMELIDVAYYADAIVDRNEIAEMNEWYEQQQLAG